jgi:hypothetical protein
MSLGLGNQLNDLLRTLGGTGTTAYALLTVHNSYTVLYGDGTKATSSSTQTAGDTAIGTNLAALLVESCHIVATLTLNECLLAFYVSYVTGIYTHHLSDGSSGSSATYRTGINGGSALENSSSQTITTWEAAATTVVTRQTATDSSLLRIDLYCEDMAGNTQQQAQNQTYTADYYSGPYNIHNIHC